MIAHFSDRGHLFQADRGRRFRAIVDAQGMRASEHLMYFTRQPSGRESRSGLVDCYFADLSTAAGGACDVPADAVGKSSWALRRRRSLVFLVA